MVGKTKNIFSMSRLDDPKIKNTKQAKAILKNWHYNARIPNSNLIDFKWVIDNHKRIDTWIKKSYEKNNSLKVHYSVLTKYLKLGNSPLWKTYSAKSTEYDNKAKEHSKEQVFDEHEQQNWVSQDTIVKTRDGYKNYQNIKDMFAYLILSLYTYQPPIRSDYANMQLFKGSVEKVPEDKQNYFVRDKGGYTIIINQDKVSGRKKGTEIQLTEDLTDIIDNSLKFYPRTYLLSQQRDPNKPLNYRALINILYQVFYPKRPGIDVLRSSYITNFYASNPNLKAREAVANLMRHSVNTQDREYYKPKAIAKPVKLSDLPVEPVELKTLAKQPGWNQKSYMQQYYKEHKNDIGKQQETYYKNNSFDILRKRLLSNLKNKNIINPSVKSIEKYKLIKNIDGTWS